MQALAFKAAVERAASTFHADARSERMNALALYLLTEERRAKSPAEIAAWREKLAVWQAADKGARS